MTVEAHTGSEGPARRTGETLHLNLGPQHPSTHGVLRLGLDLDGEVIVGCKPVIGYLHTGIEKTFEGKLYIHGVTLTDRMDYLNNLGNNLAYALSIEKLFECEIPERATVARVLLAELQRINSHLMFIGTAGLDLGASSVFLYTMRDREMLLDLFEWMSGARMMTSYIRPGGLFDDLEPDWLTACNTFLDVMPGKVDDYESLLTDNPLFKERMIGIGKLDADAAIRMGVSGPMLRASGVAHDLRKVHPYLGYETYDFDAIVADEGDCMARYKVRVAELRESLKICKQAIARMPGGPVRTSNRKVMPPPREELGTSMEAVIHHFKLYTEGMRPPAGEAYVPVESPRGELGFYIVSDGSGHPLRVHERAPSFNHIQTIPLMAQGAMVADLIAIIASIDPIMGEVDR
ncbi:MAG: NADH dehydrogenase (quinone) subunit D [Chloroflexi bacterium]|nr:NADH dehydrogenase (quinone) subunit D [Chloroflexota bacterium]